MGKKVSRQKDRRKRPGKRIYSAHWLLGASLLCLSGAMLFLVPYVSAGQAVVQAVQEEVATDGTPDGKEIPGQREEAVVAERVPDNPEEALVYDFVDWALDSFSSVVEELNIYLETESNYSLTRAGKNYEVRLQPFLLNIDDDLVVDLSPLVIICQLQGKDKLGVQVFFSPEVAHTQQWQGCG